MPRDIAHEWTDKKLEKLENRIAKVYREAWDDLEKTVIDYFERFQERDEQMKKLIGTVQNGKEWKEEDVFTARKLRRNGYSYYRLAKMYGINRETMRQAVLGITRNHLKTRRLPEGEGKPTEPPNV